MTSKDFYTCTTCKAINGIWRLHCQCCATIPTMYAIPGVVSYTLAAKGCERTEEHLGWRLNLRTVEHDYYAGA